MSAFKHIWHFLNKERTLASGKPRKRRRKQRGFGYVSPGASGRRMFRVT